MKKYSSVYSDVVASYVPNILGSAGTTSLNTSNAINNVMSGAQLLGLAHGTIKLPTKQDIHKFDLNSSMSFVPGVASSRLLRRRRAQGASKALALSLQLGSGTSAGLLLLLV